MGSKTGLRRRIVVCVDGTWFDEDGKEGEQQQNFSLGGLCPDRPCIAYREIDLYTPLLGRSRGNNSNVFRLWASVKEGLVTGEDGQEFEQVCRKQKKDFFVCTLGKSVIF